MNDARVNEVNNNHKVAIVGAGLIGRGWAIVFARAGWRVNLYDLDPGALDNAVEALRLLHLPAPVSTYVIFLLKH